MFDRIENRLLTLAFTMFLAVYWSLNALDKFFAGKEFLGLRWYGSDHAASFGDGFVHVGLRLESLENAIILAGAWQLAVSVPFFLAITFILVGRWSRLSLQAALYLGLVLSLLTLVGYCAFDIVSGNEQGVAMSLQLALVVAAAYGVARAERIFAADKAVSIGLDAVHAEARSAETGEDDPMAASVSIDDGDPEAALLVEPVRATRWFGVAPWHNWDGRRRVFR